ncbi:phage virion morphogenesis protein [Thermus tengchongensis]|uniref:phage virion morphogenesis protein n=1 Tax=Thermus tengchongensis TaxID=1214928 RepID=UPI0014318A13|nr:phage virion morphogenesis protein [Thermus tengchongensis]
MGVRLSGDWRKLSSALHRLAGGLPEEVPKAVAEGILSRTLRRFDEQRAPDGTPWPPLSPATLLGELRAKDRLKGGGYSKRALERVAKRKALIMTGRLKNSIGWKVVGSRIYVGTNVVYARIHQFGGYAGRGRKVRIPARPYLGISQEDLREAEEVLREWLRRRTR